MASLRGEFLECLSAAEDFIFANENSFMYEFTGGMSGLSNGLTHVSFSACKMWSTTLKEKVISSGGTLVIRPDSGDPVEVLPKMLHILSSNFGYTINEKGYKVLNHVNVIWG